MLHSLLLGFGQGMILDSITALSQLKSRRKWLWTDMAFGPIAAVVTFFGALLICDGQLHPVVLFGVFSGMAVEHLTAGHLLRLMTVRIARFVRRIARIFCMGLQACGRFFGKCRLIDSEKRFCRGRKSEKTRKMSHFFQKKT